MDLSTVALISNGTFERLSGLESASKLGFFRERDVSAWPRKALRVGLRTGAIFLSLQMVHLSASAVFFERAFEAKCAKVASEALANGWI